MTRFTALSALLMILTAISVQGKDFVVNNTKDMGEGTLRQAILDANSHYGPDKIVFNIPMTDSGFLPSELTSQPGSAFFIRLVSPLPKITEVLIIDGRSQTKFTGNTNPTQPSYSGSEVILLFHSSQPAVNEDYAGGVFLENYPAMESEMVTASNNTFILAATLLIQDVEMIVIRNSKQQQLMKASGGILPQR